MWHWVRWKVARQIMAPYPRLGLNWDTHSSPRLVWSRIKWKRLSKRHLCTVLYLLQLNDQSMWSSSASWNASSELRGTHVSWEAIKVKYMEHTMTNQGKTGRINLLKTFWCFFNSAKNTWKLPLERQAASRTLQVLRSQLHVECQPIKLQIQEK